MIQAVRKDYSYATSLLEKLGAYVADIGWLAILATHKPKELEVAKIPLDGTNRASAQEEIRRLYDRVEKDPTLRAWFGDMDYRIQNYMPGGNEFPPMLRVLSEISQRTAVINRKDEYKTQLEQCIQLACALNWLNLRLHDEGTRARAGLDQLREYAPE